MIDRRNHIDLPLLFAVLTLMALSLGVVYSASAAWAQHKFGESEYLLNSHMFKIAVGVFALFVGMSIHYRNYRAITRVVLFVTIVLLAATLMVGGEIKGASRWLQFGSFGFQPSELAKFALLFHLCTLLANKRDLIRDFTKGFIPMIIWVGSVIVLVMLQPNFSTGLMLLMLSLVMFFVGRARFSHVALTCVALLPLLLLYFLSADYRLRRLQSFLSPFTADGAGENANYQLWQGIIGFGNGGLFGVGPGESKQRDFFLPESYGDFVFSIVGEEYGFIGTMLFMILFLMIMMRGFKIAACARDEFGYYLAIGITSTISLYALVNAGVALGIVPTTGLPMPFVSYGGSSILFSSFAVGVLLNISAHTDLHPRAVKVPVVGTVYASGHHASASPKVRQDSFGGVLRTGGQADTAVGKVY